MKYKHSSQLAFGLGIVTTMSVTLATPAAAQPIPTSWQWRAMRTIGFIAQANNRYVSTDPERDGTLRGFTSKPTNLEHYLTLGDCERFGCALMAESTGRFVTIGTGYDGAHYGTLQAKSYLMGFKDLFFTEGNCSVACALKSRGTGRYVTVHTEYPGDDYGTLRATADTIGASEKFNLVSEFCPVYGCGIQAVSNDKYVTADIESVENNGLLRAAVDRLALWERFILLGDCRSGQGCAIKSLANGKYVTADIERKVDYGLLRAMAGTTGSWERMVLHGECMAPAGCGIMSLANNRHVTADSRRQDAYQGMLRAATPATKPWDRFRLVP